MQYVSYADAHNIADRELVVIDCHYPRGLALAHLYEPRVPASVRSNTSTEAVLKAIEQGLLADRRYVTCNHWDIDGFLGVWSALNPQVAVQHQELLAAAAMLGDFREFDHSSVSGLRALGLCTALNELESTRFCNPFGDLDDATIEHEVAEKKFKYFLPLLGDLVESKEHVGGCDEYDRVLSDLEYVRSSVRLEEFEPVGLTYVETPRPLHYYALFSSVRGGLVMTHVSARSYVEIEYRYETRVGRVDRKTIQRKDLSELAKALTEAETADGIRWVFDNIFSGGPMLRPEHIDRPLTAEERYQSMAYRLDRRAELRTSLDPAEVRALLVQALSN